MAVLLYYPLVKPPTEILHQSLLYWDGVASVVPMSPHVYEAAVPVELRDLRDRSLYTPLVLEPDSLNSLERPFGGSRSSRTGASELLHQELRRIALDARRSGRPLQRDALIYLSKISEWLEDELLHLGLAEPVNHGHWRLAVTEEVQQLIIGVIARELASSSRVSYVPYTDRADAHDLTLRPQPDFRRARLAAWEMEIGSLLPVPAPGTSMAEVLAFRERYSDERQNLMRALHRMLADLRRDYEHPADVLAQMSREIEHAVQDYRAAAKSSRMAWVNRSVMVTVALGAAAGSAMQPGLTWVLGAVGGYALNVATREIRPMGRARQDHSFSYLHRIQESLS